MPLNQIIDEPISPMRTKVVKPYAFASNIA